MGVSIEPEARLGLEAAPRTAGESRPDPLLDCLVALTRLHGTPLSRDALTAGLPLVASGLTPTLFARAASRAGFESRVIRRDLAKIDTALLPVVLLLKGETACLLARWDESGEHATVLMPDAGQGEVVLAREELLARYEGVAIVAKPRFRFDARTPRTEGAPTQHWFWSALREQLPLYRDLLGAAFLVNLIALASPLFSMNVYDRVVPNFAEGTLWMLALGLLLVIGTDYTLRLMRAYFVDLAGTRIDLKLSTQIIDRVLGMKLTDRPQSVGAYANVVRSFESIRDFIASATVTAVVDVPFAILFLIVMTWIAWPLVLPPVIGIAAVAAYSFVAQRKMHELAETTYRASAQRNASLIEALTALETVKSLGAERVVQTRLEETAEFLSNTSAKLRFASASVTNAVASMQQLVTLVTIVCGVYLIHAGALTLGGLIASSMLAGRAMGPLAQVVGLMLQFQNARTALESLEQTMKRETERPAGRKYLHRPSLTGEIAFHDVHFAYPNREQAALAGVTLRIRAGEKVVVIGRVGSGKTTLQRLMLGLYPPTEGTITFDGIDVRQLDPAELRRNIGYVEQNATLFYGTLRDNIAVASPLADDAAVLAAAQVGGLMPLANRHPQGFDMVVGERGESLSGGQRQGVAIARAALMDPPILLMDEPTGAMDYSSEAEFKERLRQFGRDKTVVLVSHRSSLLDLADRIIVMDEGRIVADGPRAKVIADLEAGRVRRAS